MLRKYNRVWFGHPGHIYVTEHSDSSFCVQLEAYSDCKLPKLKKYVTYDIILCKIFLHILKLLQIKITHAHACSSRYVDICGFPENLLYFSKKIDVIPKPL